MKPKILIIDDGVDSWHLLNTTLKPITTILCGLPMGCRPSVRPSDSQLLQCCRGSGAG